PRAAARQVRARAAGGRSHVVRARVLQCGIGARRGRALARPEEEARSGPLVRERRGRDGAVVEAGRRPQIPVRLLSWRGAREVRERDSRSLRRLRSRRTVGRERHRRRSQVSAPAPASQPRVAAFFDLDGTLLSTSSALLYVKYLRGRPKGPTPFDRMPFSALLKTIWYQVLYNANRIDIDRVVHEATDPLAGHPESRMIELCTQWFREVVARFIRPEMPRLLEAHREAGHRICLLTASTPYVAVPLCERLGIS